MWYLLDESKELVKGGAGGRAGINQIQVYQRGNHL